MHWPVWESHFDNHQCGVVLFSGKRIKQDLLRLLQMECEQKWFLHVLFLSASSIPDMFEYFQPHWDRFSSTVDLLMAPSACRNRSPVDGISAGVAWVWNKIQNPMALWLTLSSTLAYPIWSFWSIDMHRSSESHLILVVQCWFEIIIHVHGFLCLWWYLKMI